MKRKSLAVLAVMLLLSAALLSGCSQNNTHVSQNTLPNSNYYADGELVFLKAGDTYELDVNSRLYSSDTSVITVRGNKVIAHSAGIAKVGIVNPGSLRGAGCAATVFVTDEKNMTEIHTARDLDNIRNDLGGFYILKDNIDLADWGNWQPIGQFQPAVGGGFRFDEFRGMFINPYGYSIKNLTIDVGVAAGNTVLDEAGLFATIREAYIDGIILENVRISSLNSALSCAGGIVGIAFPENTVIRNCKVSGEIVSREYAGGIAGVSYCYIFDCQFAGKVQAVKLPDVNSSRGLAGGIVGFFYSSQRTLPPLPHDGDIKNCSAVGE